MLKRLGAFAGSMTLGGLLLLTAAPNSQAAVSGCWAEKADSTTGQGGCDNVTGSSTWRVGWICSGNYRWTEWDNFPGFVTVSCTSGTLTHIWVDRRQ